MKTTCFLALLTFGLVGPILKTSGADALDPAVQAKVDDQIKIIKSWAADPVIVNAVKAENASLPPAYAAMTQAQWKDLSKMDPFVRAFDKNVAGAFLKGKKTM
jgi:hypothetical protein